MKTVTVIFPVVFLFLMGIHPQQKYKLQCVIKDIDKVSGKLEVALYNNEESFPKGGKEYMSRTFPVTSNTITFSYCLEPGDYAIACYYDENMNDHFDKNFIGIPREKFGFSNNLHPLFKSPSFEKAKIHLVRDTTIIIHLIHY